MAKRMIISTAMMTLVLSCTAPAQIQGGNVIRGKVRNSAGSNLAHIRVDLEAGNGPLIQQTVTNTEGDFYFSNLPDTSYAVVVSAPDYEPVTERVDFFRQAANAPGEARMVEITLVPKGSVRPSRPGLNFVQNIPKAAQTSYESALKLSKQGKKEEAIAALQEAIRIFPNYFNAHFLLGSEFMKAGKHGEAIAQLDEARRINPRDDRIYELFGIVLMQQKKYAVAAAVFAEASRLNALEPQYPLMRGIALIEHASSISPGTSKSAAAERISILVDAEKNLTRAYELSNRKLSTVHLQLARVYEKQGNLLRAASELEQYLKENPDSANAGAIRDGIKMLRSKQ
jgi:Tfp pilus assembly protein PilF